MGFLSEQHENVNKGLSLRGTAKYHSVPVLKQHSDDHLSRRRSKKPADEWSLLKRGPFLHLYVFFKRRAPDPLEWRRKTNKEKEPLAAIPSGHTGFDILSGNPQNAPPDAPHAYAAVLRPTRSSDLEAAD